MLASTERLARPGLRALARGLALAATLLQPAAAGAASFRAEVRVHGTAEEVTALQATLRSLFPAEVALMVSSVDAVDGAQVMRESSSPSSEDVVARAWIELHDGQRVTLYVADVAGERVLVRHLPRNDEDGALVREATARIVATALEALLGGAQIGVERAKVDEELTRSSAPAPAPAPPVSVATPTAPAAPAPPAARARPDHLSFRAGAQYGVQLFSSEVPLVHGPGVVVSGGPRAGVTRPGALVSAQVWWPSGASDAVAGVRVYATNLRVLATLERSLGSSVDMSLGLGGGIDWTRVEATPNGAARSVELAPPTTLTTPALRAALGTRFRYSGGFSIYTSLALDADPSHTRYVSLQDGVASRILQPHALRPSLVLGVATP